MYVFLQEMFLCKCISEAGKDDGAGKVISIHGSILISSDFLHLKAEARKRGSVGSVSGKRRRSESELRSRKAGTVPFGAIVDRYRVEEYSPPSQFDLTKNAKGAGRLQMRHHL